VVRRICTARLRCGTPRQPRWSSDGRAIVFAGPAIRIVYTDGSCLNCKFGAATDPAFKPGGTVISFIQRRRVKLDGIDGARKLGPDLGPAGRGDLGGLLAAPYAALVKESADEHYGGSGEVVHVFDLHSGQVGKGHGGESAGCPEVSPYLGRAVCGAVRQVVLGSDGVSAARTSAIAPVHGSRSG
jgi:hypothetical protein